MRTLLLLALLTLGVACSPEDGPVCLPDVDVDGQRGQVIMSKNETPDGIHRFVYRLGCEGLYGSLLSTDVDYQIGDVYVTHQDYEPGLNHGEN